MKQAPSTVRRALQALRKLVGEGEELAEPELRNLLKLSAAALFSITTAGVAGLIGNFVVRGGSQPYPPLWVKLGPRAELTRRPRLFVLTYWVQEGWYRREHRRVVYSFLGSQNEIIVLSAICSHLACTVRLDRDAAGFECPCHGGFFDLEGRVLKGPPTKPLARLEWKFENDDIQVRTI